MPLVFRKNQSTPLTNDQVDGNFEFLKEQIESKYSTSDFTAANISLKLRTTSANQTSAQLSEANAINSWLLRDLAPSSTLPSATDKSSIVSRSSTGDITVNSVTGNLVGNALTATTASEAVKLQTSRTINGIAFDGTSNITIADTTKLPLSGGTLTGTLTLYSGGSSAPVNFGTADGAPGTVNNGDVWATTSGLFYKISGETTQIAPIVSPIFTGTPRAPGYTLGTVSQIVTISHLDNAKNLLTSDINLKAPLNSPQFTGNVTAPTPATNSAPTTIVATTAYTTNVVNAKATEITTQYQNYTTNAISNYATIVNNLLALKANLDSPNLTGNPTAPTQVTTDNSNRIANTAFIANAINSLKSILDGDIAALRNYVDTSKSVPTGAVFYMATSVVPNGYLECDGSWVLKSQYESLWQALGFPVLGTGVNALKFQLPDLRGEFVRGWDHGRGVDRNFAGSASREILSWQIGSLHIHNDENDTYTGGVWNNMWTNGSGYSHANDASQPYGNGHANQLGYDSMTFEFLGAYANTTILPWSSNSAAFGGTQEFKSGTISLQPGTAYRSNHWIFMSRPRNVALMPVIKY